MGKNCSFFSLFFFFFSATRTKKIPKLQRLLIASQGPCVGTRFFLQRINFETKNFQCSIQNKHSSSCVIKRTACVLKDRPKKKEIPTLRKGKREQGREKLMELVFLLLEENTTQLPNAADHVLETKISLDFFLLFGGAKERRNDIFSFVF